MDKGYKTAFAAVVVFIGGLNMLAPAAPPPALRLLASLILGVAGIVVMAWWRGAPWANPFIGLFAGIYGVYYGLPVFVLERFSRGYHLTDVIADEAVEEALWLALGGLLACLAGYQIMHMRRFRDRLPQVRMVWKSTAVIRRFGFAFGVVGICACYVFLFEKVPLWAQQAALYVTDLSLFGIVMLLAVQLMRGLNLLGCVLLWLGLVPMRIGLGFATGATAQAIEVGLILAMGYCLIRRTVPWRSLILVFAALLILLPVRQEFRALTWSREAAQLSPLDKAILYPVVVGEHLGALELDRTLQISLFRLAHLMTFAEVVERTPGEVPYVLGMTYYPLLFKLIPRPLYPEKPTVETGQWFGHHYGFLDSQDTATSYNLPQLVELYVNFGPWGVIIGMFAIGMLYALVVRLFIHRDAGVGALVAGAYVLGRLLLIESGTALVLGALIWNLVFVAGIHGMIRVGGDLR